MTPDLTPTLDRRPAGLCGPEPGARSRVARVSATAAHCLSQNHLLAALPAADLAPLLAQLELVPLLLGERLHERGGCLLHAYFPTTAILSLHHVTLAGGACETAGVGNEGMVGVALLTGAGTTPGAALVHTAGHAYRLHHGLIKQQFDQPGWLQHLLMGYIQALITQIAQTAVCNRHHSVEQQLCRWLLCTLDRMSSPELVLTQEMIAGLLGVRREGITLAADNLQRAGCIHSRRGHLTVLDRHGLEQRACECYAVVKKELGRIAQRPRRAAVA